MKYSSAEQKKLFDCSRNFLSNLPGADQLDSLIDVLQFHEYKYYVENQPLITDKEYDILFNQLKALELENPLLIRQDSPTQRVASDLTDSFNSVKHLTPMLSLGNAYNLEDLNDFNKQLVKLSGSEELDYSIEPKFDGGSIALVYEDDRLVRAATRGNGVKGDDISINARTIRSIPLKASFSKYKIYKAELRGEVVIRKDVFDRKNLEREANGISTFANPRNAATGGLRMKDPNEVANRGLVAFIFQISLAEDKNGDSVLNDLESHYHSIEVLSNLGFKVAKNEIKKFSSMDSVWAFAQKMEEERDAYPYEIDGMVIKLDDFRLQDKCGYTQHHPRWAIALKFEAKQATTKLLSVEYQVGKVGSITPVAKVEPVHLAGVTVSSISLHNADFIEQKDLYLGDMLVIERAGDVIPYVVKSLAELRDGSQEKIQFPKYCPIPIDVEVELVRSEGESAWRCPNCVCGQQDLQKMIFHVSKDAMDIDGFGGAYIERFYELGFIRDLADLYNLDYEAIAQLEGFGEKSAANLKKAIDAVRNNPLRRILHSLSIHHLGKKASQILAGEILDIRELANWEESKFLDLKDIGPVVAKNVMEWFGNPQNIELLNRMEENGVDLSQKEDDIPVALVSDGVFSGKTILFTGKLTELNRKQAQNIATSLGAKNISAVSGNLDILVVGEKAGSKLKKAEAIGTVQIMTEQEFIVLANI
jgi:DNA ligase (NAD+)